MRSAITYKNKMSFYFNNSPYFTTCKTIFQFPTIQEKLWFTIPQKGALKDKWYYALKNRITSLLILFLFHTFVIRL